mgnify:CR=1 FL=1
MNDHAAVQLICLGGIVLCLIWIARDWWRCRRPY